MKNLRFKPGHQVICLKIENYLGEDLSDSYKQWIGTVCTITVSSDDFYDYTISMLVYFSACTFLIKI